MQTADYNNAERRGRPLIDTLEEIRQRHMEDNSPSRSKRPGSDVDIQYKRHALTEALQRLQGRFMENMEDYKMMRQRQKAAFEAIMQVQSQQKQQRNMGGGGAAPQQQAQGGPPQPQQGAAPLMPGQGPQGPAQPPQQGQGGGMPPQGGMGLLGL